MTASMSGSMSAPSARRAPRADEERELCVVVACHDVVCALPASCIERLVLPSEVEVIADGGAPGDETAWRVARIGERRYAACNLGTQLGLEPVDAAWALLVVERGGLLLPIALETGPCLVVQPLPDGVPLPAGAFRARVGAVAAGFPTALLRSKTDLNEVGLRLDLAELWTDSELDAAAAALSGEGRGG